MKITMLVTPTLRDLVKAMPDESLIAAWREGLEWEATGVLTEWVLRDVAAKSGLASSGTSTGILLTMVTHEVWRELAVRGGLVTEEY